MSQKGQPAIREYDILSSTRTLEDNVHLVHQCTIELEKRLTYFLLPLPAPEPRLGSIAPTPSLRSPQQEHLDELSGCLGQAIALLQEIDTRLPLNEVP
jgi:hypothetical protein